MALSNNSTRNTLSELADIFPIVATDDVIDWNQLSLLIYNKISQDWMNVTPGSILDTIWKNTLFQGQRWQIILKIIYQLMGKL